MHHTSGLGIIKQSKKCFISPLLIFTIRQWTVFMMMMQLDMWVVRPSFCPTPDLTINLILENMPRPDQARS